MTYPIIPFQNRLQPALVDRGFAMDDYWVWCGSVVPGDDGRYHMFASRWPKQYPFYHGYLAASEIVRAVADHPAGPYEFAEVVLPARGPEYWDGRMTHNPMILKTDDEYLLFYIGVTYDRPTPTAEEMDALRSHPGGNGKIFPWFNQIRIGLARASSVTGPWTRLDRPILEPRPDCWESRIVTNPCPVLTGDGSIYLYYRSNAKLGLAIAADADGPFIRHGDAPAVDLGEGMRIEDPYVFWHHDHFEMICKDLTGKIVDEFHAAIHLHSPNGRDWQLVDPAKAWSRTIDWSDGSTRTMANIERPFILMQDGKPAYLFAATADGPGPRDSRPGFYFAENTWNMVMPLANP